MKKRLICSMLLGLILTLMICVSAQAEPVASGKFGREHLAMEWSVEGNTLYITGNGFMDGFSMNDSRPWDLYRDQIQRVVMTGTIDNIAYYAFEGCTKLTEIVWPDGLKYINDHAFSGCTALESVTIPGSVEIIYDHVFNQCTSLKEVTILEGVKKIGQYSFADCTALRTVNLPPKLREIGRGCFYRCKALQKIQLPTTLELLGSGAFRESGLVEIDIPERVQELSGTFFDCTNLEKVTFSGNRFLKVLGNDLFRNCKALTALHIPKSVTTVYADAFVECQRLDNVYFYGNMPELIPSYVYPIFLTFYYADGNTTWKQEEIDKFTQGNRGEVQFQSIVYQLPDESVTEPPATEPPATKPPATEPPVTEPPATKPPATEPPATKPPVTEPPVTEPPATESAPTATEETLAQSGDSGTETTDNTTMEAADEKEPTASANDEQKTPGTFPWAVVCISAAVILAGGGTLLWFKKKK